MVHRNEERRAGDVRALVHDGDLVVARDGGHPLDGDPAGVDHFRDGMRGRFGAAERDFEFGSAGDGAQRTWGAKDVFSLNRGGGSAWGADIYTYM